MRNPIALAIVHPFEDNLRSLMRAIQTVIFAHLNRHRRFRWIARTVHLLLISPAPFAHRLYVDEEVLAQPDGKFWGFPGTGGDR
jgi:hypothetical protein